MTHPRFVEIVKELIDLHAKKSSDYGSTNEPLGNLHAIKRLGFDPFVGVAVRMQDKMARLESYVNKDQLYCEGIEDTLRDIAVYAILGIILLEQPTQYKQRSRKMIKHKETPDMVWFRFESDSVRDQFEKTLLKKHACKEVMAAVIDARAVVKREMVQAWEAISEELGVSKDITLSYHNKERAVGVPREAWESKDKTEENIR